MQTCPIAHHVDAHILLVFVSDNMVYRIFIDVDTDLSLYVLCPTCCPIAYLQFSCDCTDSPSVLILSSYCYYFNCLCSVLLVAYHTLGNCMVGQ